MSKIPKPKPERRSLPNATEGSAPLEKVVQRRISRALNAIDGVECQTHTVTPWAERGHSDLYGVAWGRAFFIEVKRGPNIAPTHHQEKFLDRMARAGAITGVAWCVAEALKILLGDVFEGGERAARGAGC